MACKVIDKDTHFVIDPITRAITNESSKKLVLVRKDHNSERFTFKCPRYIEGHDMMECDRITLHYNNINATTKSEESKGMYEVNDVQGDEENITFTWLISENATVHVGTLVFLVCFECIENNVVVYRWQTGINKTIVVSDGIDNSEVVETEAYADIIAQWKAELFEAGGNAVVNVNLARQEALEAIKTEGATQVQSVKDEGTTQVENVRAVAEAVASDREQIHLNHALKASVIEGSAEGEVILLKDSAEQPFVEMSVFGKSEQLTTTGKNLFNPANVVNGYPYNITGLFVENSANRTGVIECEPNTTYTVSKMLGSRFAVAYTTEYPSEGVAIYGMIPDYDAENLTITTGSDATYLLVWAYNGNVDTEITDKEMLETVMIEKGSVVTEYEPYTGGIPSPNPEYPQEINSVENPTIIVKDNEENEQSLSLPYTLHGIPVTSGGNYTDTDGQQWICDEVDLERGVLVQRIGNYTITGDEGWYLSGLQNLASEGIYRYDTNYVSKNSSAVSNAMSTHYPYPTRINLEKGCWVLNDATQNLALRIMWSYATVDDLKAFLKEQYEQNTPVVVNYILANPIETALPEAEIEAFKALMTNYPYTTILNDCGANMAVRYGIDTKTYIDKKFEELKKTILSES